MTSSTKLDPLLWQHLPGKLIERIVFFLPPAALFRARCLCRRLRSLLSSAYFPAHHHHHFHRRRPYHRHWLLFFQHELPTTSFFLSTDELRPLPPALIFDTDELRWRRLHLSTFLPPGFFPAAASGGLLLLLPSSPAAASPILANPLGRSWVSLPPLHRRRLFPSAGLAAGDTAVAVLLAGDDLVSPFAVKNLSAELFLTGGAAFSPAAPLPRLCNLQTGRLIFHAGKFFCMSFSPFAVLAWDLRASAWAKVQPPMKRFLRSPSVVELGGALVVVAAVEKARLAVPRSVRLWALSRSGVGWVEMGRMPAAVHEEFAAEEKGRGFEAVGGGEVLALTIRRSPRVMVFELESRTWRWLPQCPFVEGGQGLRGFVFEPRLATPALTLLQGSLISC
ncbi:F-box family protein [Wolffia australiana]